FPQKGVVRKGPEQAAPQQDLGFAVRDGDGRQVLFPFHLDCRVKVAQGHLAGVVGGLHSDFVAVAPFGVHGRFLSAAGGLAVRSLGATRYLTVFGVSVGGGSNGSDFRNATRSSISSPFK